MEKKISSLLDHMKLKDFGSQILSRKIDFSL